MTQFLKLIGIFTIIVGVILTIVQLVSLIQVRDDLDFDALGILLAATFIKYVFYGSVCLGIAKIIELLENRK